MKSYPNAWNVRDTTLQGDDFIVRVCVGLREAIGHPDYTYQIGIAIPANWNTDSGIVSRVESNPLERIELAIGEKVESENTRLAAVLTGRNMTEFILYSSEPEIVKDKIEKLKIETSSHEIQHIIQKDPEWNTYKFIIGK